MVFPVSGVGSLKCDDMQIFTLKHTHNEFHAKQKTKRRKPEKFGNVSHSGREAHPFFSHHYGNFYMQSKTNRNKKDYHNRVMNTICYVFV